MRYNDYQQPIGDALPDYRAGETPSIDCLQGRYCRLEKLDAERHGDDLYEVYGPEAPKPSFTYLSLNPVADRAELETLLKRMEESTDPYYLAVIDQDGRAVGTLALMRINPAHRVIEVGSVTYGERLKRTRAATEVQYLLAQYVFETLHYRRYEWKCDALNEPHAAQPSVWASPMRGRSAKPSYIKTATAIRHGIQCWIPSGNSVNTGCCNG
ncbi:MAG: GNAT family N-acetyltransferase [Rothia aeria]